MIVATLRFTTVALATAALGLVLAFAIGLIVSRILQNRVEFGGLVGVGVGIGIGYPLGTILGQVLTKYIFHAKGSVWLGAAAFVLLEFLAIILPTLLHGGSPILSVCYLVIAPIAGTAGFYIGGRVKRRRLSPGIESESKK